MAPEATDQTHYRICPLCEAACGLEIRTRPAGNGRAIVSIRGDDADPFSHGYLCPKGVALKDLHEDPDRLRQPMRRRADRSGFEPVSWDEAFAEIARRLPRCANAMVPTPSPCPSAIPPRTRSACSATSRIWRGRWARATCSRPRRWTRCPSSSPAA